MPEITVKLSSAPHQDVPDNSKLVAQIIVDQIVFVQTIPVSSVDDNGDCWELAVDCKIAPSASCFSIAILCEWPKSVTRLLGTVNTKKDEFFNEMEQPQFTERPLVKVNNDGPSLLLTTSTSVLSPVLPALSERGSSPDGPHICGEPLYLNLEAIRIYLKQMYQSSRTGEQFDALQVAIMYERLLLLRDQNGIKAKLLKVLGDLCSRFHQSREANDLNTAVNIYNDALRAATRNSDVVYRIDLALCLHHRFEQLGNAEDLNWSIQIMEDVVKLTPDGHPDKPSRLTNLGGSLLRRFERVGNLVDIDRSIQVRDAALFSTPDNDHNKSSRLTNLGSSLAARFERLGDLADLNRSIQVREDAVLLTPDGHSYKPLHLFILRGLFMQRFGQLGNLADLNRSIQMMEDAVRLTPDGHPKKVLYLINLRDLLARRFEKAGDLADLDKSIRLGENAIHLTANEHLGKLSCLADLGVLLARRFDQTHDFADLNRSIQLEEDAIYLAPDRHPDKPSYLSNLGGLLTRCFDQVGDLADLNKAVKVGEDAVYLTPDGRFDKPSHLANLGGLLRCRFERLGDLADLSRSIQVREDALCLTPDVHPDKPSCLTNFGGLLLERFQWVGDHGDLNKSIQVREHAIHLTPDNHPAKPLCLSNLGSSLRRRFEHVGDLDDLNRSIQVGEDAVHLIPNGHPDKPSYLINLGSALARRFEQVGDLVDLDRSMQMMEDAVHQTPDGHPHKPLCLTSFGNVLVHRFEQLGDIAALTQSIQVREAAVHLTPDGHPAKALRLTSLGGALLHRFEQTDGLDDLNMSIQVRENAVHLTPDGHANKPLHLTNLGGSLLCRFERLGNLDDLNRSIQVRENAVHLTPDGHPNKPAHLTRLGISFHTRFKKYHNDRDLKEALSNFSFAAQSIVGSSHAKFNAAACWVLFTPRHYPDQTMEACTAAMNLIPELSWLGSSIRDRHHQVAQAGVIARYAAARALASEQYGLAVEWLEQGRSIIWSQLLQLRSPLDQLQKVNQEFADKFKWLSSQLEGSRSSDVPDINDWQPTAHVKYHRIAHEREELLKDIRQLPGLSRFLLPKQLPELLRVPAINGGRIVILNISDLGSDALILGRGLEDVLRVPLKDLTLEVSRGWRDGLQSIHINGFLTITDFGARLKAIRKPDHGKVLDREEGLAYILDELWHCVTKPVLDALAITTPMTSTSGVHRIWWCPTGPLSFLPIHAAGIYPSGPKLSDMVISSYTPTLTALSNNSRAQTAEKHQLLTIALPTESRPQLPGTGREVECVAKHAENFHVLRLLESEATKDRVSEAMESSSWAHFACHGTQESTNPTESCLWLANQSKLTLSDIINLRLENAELSFLSACETATGDKELEEEAVHLAARMLLAGYRGVIATMWTIHDAFAVEIADETYRRLFKEYNADSTRAAEALHFAIKKVLEDREAKGKKVSLFHWVPFIHIGI